MNITFSYSFLLEKVMIIVVLEKLPMIKLPLYESCIKKQVVKVLMK